MRARRRGVSVLGAVIPPVGPELTDHRRARAQPLIHLLEGVIVDLVELNVFVSTRFSRFGVGLSDQILLGAPVRRRRRLGRRPVFDGIRFGFRVRFGVGAAQQKRYEQNLKHKADAGIDIQCNLPLQTSPTQNG